MPAAKLCSDALDRAADPDALSARVGPGHKCQAAPDCDVQVQDLLICIEMFVAAVVHQRVFSYRDFAKTCGRLGRPRFCSLGSSLCPPGKPRRA